TPQWRSFAFEFTTPADAQDDNAWLFVDLGDSDAAVEMSTVHLRNPRDGSTVEPESVPLPGSFTVTYKFNAEGCRGEHVASQASGTKRVLLLGNSYALGVGIPDE